MPAAQVIPTSQDPIDEFFRALAKKGYEPLFSEQSGTLRFDVIDGEDLQRWFVTIDKGNVTVGHTNKKADAICPVQRPVLEALVTGRINGFAAFLRGDLVLEGGGDHVILMAFQRVLPSSPGQKGRVPPISSAEVMAEMQGSAH